MMTFQTLPKAGKVTCCRVHEMFGNKTHIAGKRVWSISRPVSVLLVPSLLIEWDPTFRSGSHYVALVPLTLMGHPNMWKHIWPCQRCAFECVANVLELTLELLGSTNAIQCTHKHTSRVVTSRISRIHHVYMRSRMRQFGTLFVRIGVEAALIEAEFQVRAAAVFLCVGQNNLPSLTAAPIEFYAVS